MNQDSSFPPMLPPSTELGALLFAILPCLQDAYRPLASFAYHMTELTRLKSIPSMPQISGISGIDALITDKDIMLHSLSFYGRMFRMPLLSTIATLLQGLQFYQAYKDILPGLFSSTGNSGGDASPFGNMAGLFSGLGGMTGSGSSSPDLFSILGGLSPDLLSSLFSGFTGNPAPHSNKSPSTSDETIPAPDTSLQESSPVHAPEAPFPASDSPEPPASNTQADASFSDDTLYNTLQSFLTPEQQKIYEQLMHTD